MQTISEKTLDARARRAARRVGLIARKSRRDSIDNCGGFKLIEPSGNYPVAGFSYDMTAKDVIAECKDYRRLPRQLASRLEGAAGPGAFAWNGATARRRDSHVPGARPSGRASRQAEQDRHSQP